MYLSTNTPPPPLSKRGPRRVPRTVPHILIRLVRDTVNSNGIRDSGRLYYYTYIVVV